MPYILHVQLARGLKRTRSFSNCNCFYFLSRDVLQRILGFSRLEIKLGLHAILEKFCQ